MRYPVIYPPFKLNCSLYLYLKDDRAVFLFLYDLCRMPFPALYPSGIAFAEFQDNLHRSAIPPHSPTRLKIFVDVKIIRDGIWHIGYFDFFNAIQGKDSYLIAEMAISDEIP